MPSSQVKQRYVDVLLTHVMSDKYPSTSMLDQLERCLTDEQREEYITALIDKLANDRFPSTDMMARVCRLVS